MKRGFTLAEALITIAIIGVVASITLPTINNNIWKSQQKAAVKNMTAKIQNSLDIAIGELGYVPHCGYWGSYNPNKILGYETKATEWNDDGSVKKWETFDKDGNTVKAVGGSNGMIEDRDCLALGKLMEKHLSITKKCNGFKNCKASYSGSDTRTYNKYKEEGSIPEDEYEDIKKITGSDDYETNLSYYAQKVNGGSGSKQYYIDKSYALYLKDNSYILNLSHPANPSFYPRWYAIDINGIKGPNKWGHDLFYIYTRYEKDGNSLGMDTSTTVSECYNGYKGQSIDDIIQNKAPAKCTK